MNNPDFPEGFSFFELIVVISILSLVLIFAFPLFRGRIAGSKDTWQASELVPLIESLKRKAVSENKDFFLHIEPSSNRFRVDDKQNDAENKPEGDGHGAFELDSAILISGVEFKNRSIEDPAGIRIGFYRQGYSDAALIHLREDGRDATLKIPVFLNRVQFLDRYVSYDDCR